METYGPTTALFYDHYHTGPAGYVPFYVSEAVKAGSPVLELGCGTGRVLIPTAEAGISVVGLDLSPTMLAVAQRKIAASDLESQHRITLIEGDMRTFSLAQHFNLVMIPFSAFLYLLTPEDQQQALLSIHRHLADTGHLVLDIYEPDAHTLAIQGHPLKRIGTFTHPHSGNQIIAWEERRFDSDGQIWRMWDIFEEVDQKGRVIARAYEMHTNRYIHRYQMHYLFERCGYQVVDLYGDYMGNPYPTRNPDSRYGRRQIWVARKR